MLACIAIWFNRSPFKQTNRYLFGHIFEASSEPSAFDAQALILILEPVLICLMLFGSLEKRSDWSGVLIRLPNHRHETAIPKPSVCRRLNERNISFAVIRSGISKHRLRFQNSDENASCNCHRYINEGEKERERTAGLHEATAK